MQQAKLKDVLTSDEEKLIKIAYKESLLVDLSIRDIYQFDLIILKTEYNNSILPEMNTVSETWQILTKRAIRLNLTIF